MKSRRKMWTMHVVHFGEMKNVYRMVVGKPEGKRPLKRPEYNWMDNINLDLRETLDGCGFMF
jgi:hypothetical protein